MSTEASSSECNPPVAQSKISTPPSVRWLQVILPAVAIAGWLIFVGACVGGPAWSPDGSKILFGYHDQQNARSVIALYDRKTHKLRDLFAEQIPPDEKKDENFVLAPAWQADGTRALVATTTRADDDLHCSILSFPLRAGDVLRAYHFSKKTVCYSMSWTVQSGDNLYLGGGEGLEWINLRTGARDSKTIEGGTGFISEHNGQVVYMREVDRPAPTAEKADATESGVEFGQIDLRGVNLKPFFSIWGQQEKDLGLTENLGGSWEPNGTRIAVVSKSEGINRVILLDEQKGFVTQFTPELGVKLERLGPLVWSHDRATLYGPAILKEQDKSYVYALVEIAVSGNSGRITRIANFHEEELEQDEEMNMLFLGLQVSLSPDGKTIAASTATLRDAVAEEDRGLFLIDVSRQEHRLTRIHAPLGTD